MTSNALTTVVLCFALAVTAAIGGFMYANTRAVAAPTSATAPADPTPSPTPLKTYAPERIEDAEGTAPDGYWDDDDAGNEMLDDAGIDNYDLDLMEREYIVFLQNYFGVDFSAIEETDWVADGKNSICYDFDMGSTQADVISGYSAQRGINEVDGGFVVSSAVATFCPEYV